MPFKLNPILVAALAAGISLPSMADDAALLRQMQEQMQQLQAQIETMAKKLAEQGESQKKVADKVAKTEEETKARDKALEVYGRVQVSVNNYSEDWGAAKKGTTAKSNASYIGMKGSTPTTIGDTDLIYMAEFQYESADDDSTAFKFREAFAGLKGGWGQARLGRLSTAYKATLTKIDPWLDLEPQSRGNNGTLGSSSLHSNYFNNAVEYLSPTFAGGFTGAIWHSQQLEGETSPIHNAAPVNNYLGGTASGLGVKYESGPFYVGLDSATIDAEDCNGATAGTACSGGLLMDNGSAWQIAARYNPGPWSVALLYEDSKDLGMGTNLYLNGIYKLDKTSLIATLGQNRDATQTAGKKYDSWSLGVRHPISKTSDVFAAYVKRTEDSGATSKDFDVISVGINAYFGK